MYENIETFKDILVEQNERIKLFSEDQIKDIIDHLALT